jgi:glucosamine--fructose-6-phosphate aminotransferase (isomerizing)
MCGIIGYIGYIPGLENSFNGLKMLLNRGYDSCGCAILDKNNNFIIRKYASKENKTAYDLLEEKKSDFTNSELMILHSRWAVSGAKTDENAHPHIDCRGLFSIVHNGIIENYEIIKSMLINNGYTFVSETDTEVVANLISFYYAEENNVESAIRKTLSKLEGTYALCIIDKKDENTLYCVRNGSPLLVALNEKFAMIGSEKSAFENCIDNYICLDNNDLCKLKKKDGKIIMESEKEYKLNIIKKTNESITPHPYPHWTLKEIMDQPEVALRATGMGTRVENDTTVRLGGLEEKKSLLSEISDLIILGCGTSYHSGLYSSHFFKDLCNFNTVQVFDGAEFNINDLPKTTDMSKIAFILISQSGETKDLHRCIEIAKTHNILTIGVVNVVDSLIAREVDCGVYLNAGREIAVASTKAFTSQVIVLCLMSIWFSQNINLNLIKRQKYIKDIKNLKSDIEETLNVNLSVTQNIAKYLLNKSSLFVLGKGNCEPIAKEGSLKIKEIGYIHAEGYSSSALKHGPFALLERGLPVILMTPNNEHFIRNQGIADEIKARHAFLIGISDVLLPNKYDIQIKIPHNNTFNGLLSALPMQLIAYNLALLKKHNPDMPKNLAKVVTVD